jgi:hypothetical protein
MRFKWANIEKLAAVFSAKWFSISVGALLGLTGFAKVSSAFGSAKVLFAIDPITTISFKHLMLAVGTCELLIACTCVFSRAETLSLILTGCFATLCLVYRLGLIWIGYHRTCTCLGNLTDALHISPEVADRTMRIILAYLLIGSYALLFRIWKRNWRASASSSPKMGTIRAVP